MILSLPFFKSLNTGEITVAFMFFGWSTLKYSALARFKNNSPSFSSALIASVTVVPQNSYKFLALLTLMVVPISSL